MDDDGMLLATGLEPHGPGREGQPLREATRGARPRVSWGSSDPFQAIKPHVGLSFTCQGQTPEHYFLFWEMVVI